MQQTWWTPQPQLAENQLWADIYVICSLFSATCLLVFSVTMHHHLWLMEMDVFEAAHLRLRVWLWDHGVEILIFVFLGIVQVQNVNLEAGFCFTSLHFRVVSCSLWVFQVQSINEEMLQRGTWLWMQPNDADSLYLVGTEDDLADWNSSSLFSF